MTPEQTAKIDELLDLLLDAIKRCAVKDGSNSAAGFATALEILVRLRDAK